jgi:hypothetical protein
MATTTPNYGWTVPTSSDLVKNGATAIETLGDSVDASLWSSGLGQAAKNKIINGNFGIWQRGTSFTSIANLSYTADRFYEAHDGTGTVNVTRQAFTPGTAPVAGYEGSYFYRQAVTSSGTTTFFQTAQKIEDVTTFAGQTVKVSFWAKADSARTGLVYGDQLFGSGGSAQVQLDVNYFAMTTSWQRFSFTYSIPSIAGKTIGTGSSVAFYFRNGGTTAGATIDLWGIQVEAGSTATPFQTATGTIQGELAACQRYYWRVNSSEGSNYSPMIYGYSRSTTSVSGQITFPVKMRVSPTSLDTANLAFLYGAGTVTSMSSLSLDLTNPSAASITSTVASMTANLPGFIVANNSSSAFIGFNAEL